MKIAFILRSTLYTVPGGDTIQVQQTAKYLRKLGAEADILLTNSPINYNEYDLFHFFNLNRPADILGHIDHIKKPIFISPVLVDYSEFDKDHRTGIPGKMLRYFSPSQSGNEYVKTVSRWITGKDVLQSKDYLWKGQKKSIKYILEMTTALLPNSEAEYLDVKKMLNREKPYSVVPNGIDASIFIPDEKIIKEDKLVICAARIEGIKNQLNLIKAVNDTEYTLIIIGAPGPNHKKYYDECRSVASANIIFKEHIPQRELARYYASAKVHVLPSWFETCGLSSLEAAAMGCNIVVTDKGYTREYFGDEAFYCDPGNPVSIFSAIEKASRSDSKASLQKKILEQYTWQRAAAITLQAYRKYGSG